jgi:hypothetical protein
MTTFNKQRIFNKVAKHLLKQGVKCQTNRGTCRYRGSEGKTCAIGCLIPDSLYDPQIENMGIHVAFNYAAPYEGLIAPLVKPRAGTRKRVLMDILAGATGASTAEHYYFLRQLQSVHDGYEPDEWRGELKDLADKYDLKGPPHV